MTRRRGSSCRRALRHDEDDAVRALSRAQLRRLLEIAPERYKLLLGLLASTGLRISEARALQWKHVDQGAEPAIRVRRAVVRKRIERPKSRHGVRRVPLPPTLAEALADARTRAKDPGDDGLVFTSRRGTPIDPDNLRRRMLVPLLAKVGVDAGRLASVETHVCVYPARGWPVRRPGEPDARPPLAGLHAGHVHASPGR